jgi:hypothetical protein
MLFKREISFGVVAIMMTSLVIIDSADGRNHKPTIAQIEAAKKEAKQAGTRVDDAL